MFPSRKMCLWGKLLLGNAAVNLCSFWFSIAFWLTAPVATAVAHLVQNENTQHLWITVGPFCYCPREPQPRHACSQEARGKEGVQGAILWLFLHPASRR